MVFFKASNANFLYANFNVLRPCQHVISPMPLCSVHKASVANSLTTTTRVRNAKATSACAFHYFVHPTEKNFFWTLVHTLIANHKYVKVSDNLSGYQKMKANFLRKEKQRNGHLV